MVRLEFEIKLEPLLLYSPPPAATPAAAATPTAATTSVLTVQPKDSQVPSHSPAEQSCQKDTGLQTLLLF